MSQPENTTTSRSAQVGPALGCEVELENCSHSMTDAGTFVWALGSLLRQLYKHELQDEVLGSGIMDGLAAGLLLVGGRLMDEGSGAQALLNKRAVAQGGAQ